MTGRAGWKKLLLAASAALCSYSAAWAETRLALVVGNAAYPEAPLKTAVNDAALVGETLRQLGFDVSEGRDLDQTTLRRLVRDFAAKIEATDGDITVYIYLAGHGAQAVAQNYFMPTDARIVRPADVAAESLSIETLLRDTQNQKVKTRLVVLDAATQFPAGVAAKLSPGLATLSSAPDTIIAASASPTEVMPPQTGDYGAYALALTQTMREPGLQPDEIFNRVKLKVHQDTKGAVTPSHVSTLARPFVFLERAPDAPPVQPQAAADPRKMAYRDLDPATAYALAIERDTLKDYREFLAVFPNDPLAKKIRARMAQKREARAWQLAARKRTREALWTYRKHYPRGVHYEEAGYELAELGAPLAPPPDFTSERWDEFEPPPPDEITYYEEIVAEPMTYRSVVPPPPPAYFVPPSPAYEYVPPPPPSSGPGMLPLIGLGALGAAAIIPQIVKRPPPRMQQPVAMPQRPPSAPIVVNPPPVAGPRPPGANQIAPQPPVSAGAPQPGMRPPMPGQIPPAPNRGPLPPAVMPPPVAGATPPRPQVPAGQKPQGAPIAVPSPVPPTIPPVPPAKPPVASPAGAPVAGSPSVPPPRGLRLDRRGQPPGLPGQPPSLQGQPPSATNPPAARAPAVIRPPATPGAITRDVQPRPLAPPAARPSVPPPAAAQPRTLAPPVAAPRMPPAPQPVFRPPPRPAPPVMRAPPPPTAAPPPRPAAPVMRPPTPPPMAAPPPRPSPPPMAAPPPRQAPSGRPNCAPGDPRPQCR